MEMSEFNDERFKESNLLSKSSSPQSQQSASYASQQQSSSFAPESLYEFNQLSDCKLAQQSSDVFSQVVRNANLFETGGGGGSVGNGCNNGSAACALVEAASAATGAASNASNTQFETNTFTSYGQQHILTNINNYFGEKVNETKDYYQWLSSFADPRVENWPMMSSPMPTLIVFFVYLLIANYGPKLMKSRKPFQLRFLLIVYNLYVALLNLWIACELCYCSYKLNYNSLCQLVLIKNDPYLLRIAAGVWWYFASKGIEFADTLFFILRKKDRQLTFLHKYHHSSMFLVWWTAVRFVPGGSAIIPIVVNSLVHVLMYAYYGLSALGPGMQKYLWWKKHLTRIQLIQFFIGVSIGIRLITTNCQFTRWMQYVFSGYAFSFIILFGNFYLHEYIKGKKSLKSTAATTTLIKSDTNNTLVGNKLKEL